jgi:hypothetical protein
MSVTQSRSLSCFVEIPWVQVNMLAELYMSMDNYQQASALIDDTNKRLSNQSLPLDLTINFGICQAHLGNIVIAEVRHLPLSLQSDAIVQPCVASI